MTEPHEIHVCRDCGAEITLPYGRVDRNLEGYWERAYWRVVPELQKALDPHGGEGVRARLEHEGRIHEAHIKSGIPDRWCRYCFQLQRPGVAFDDERRSSRRVDNPESS